MGWKRTYRLANPRGVEACTNAKRHPDYLPGCDFRTSESMVVVRALFVKKSATWRAP